MCLGRREIVKLVQNARWLNEIAVIIAVCSPQHKVSLMLTRSVIGKNDLGRTTVSIIVIKTV